MRIIKNILAASFAILLILIGILLTVNNQQLVTVDLVFFQMPEASLARWLILSFLMGAVLSLILSSFAVMAMNMRLRRARKKLNDSNSELDKLRTLNINANH